MLRTHRVSLALKIACGVILTVLFISVINMQIQLKSLRERKEALEEQIAEIKDDIEETKYRLSEEVNDAYIERYAREVLGYRYPNEILFYNDVAG
ncbi:MAG: septum formation initiator family protein [Clostridia bacterium]|nr:septum formation initiator family protein [Clostridia bacterium]